MEAPPKKPPDGINRDRTFQKYIYDEKDAAPYRIIVQLVDDKMGDVRINKLSVGRLLSNLATIRQNVSNIRTLGRNKVLVFMNTYQSANELQDSSELKSFCYTAYIPRSFVTVSGVVAGVPTDMTIDEISDNISCDVPILSINRLHRYNGNEKQETHKIGIAFRANKLPSNVRIFCCINKVRPFISKPVLCLNCLRYNHRAENCRSRPRCKNCTQQHENINTDECMYKTKCLYCKVESDHHTADATCPEWIRQRNIKTIMAKTTLSYMEAKEQNPILTQNRYEALDRADEYPSIPESFATMAKGSYRMKEGFRYKTQQTKRPLQDVNIADQIIVNTDNKKKKNDGEECGVPLFNKYRVSDLERWTQRLGEHKQDDIPRNFGENQTMKTASNNGTIKKRNDYNLRRSQVDWSQISLPASQSNTNQSIDPRKRAQQQENNNADMEL